MTSDIEPQFAFAFEIRAEVEPPLHVGHAGAPMLSFTPIVGGSVDGPRLKGEVLSGGGDWATLRSNDVCELDARYLIRADDGATIDIVNRGFWFAEPDVIADLEAGKTVDPSRYYFRTQPAFRTDAPEHEWLTRTVFFGMAYDEIHEEGQVRIKMYEVL